jgi:hypothetical protein
LTPLKAQHFFFCSNEILLWRLPPVIGIAHNNDSAILSQLLWRLLQLASAS